MSTTLAPIQTVNRPAADNPGAHEAVSDPLQKALLRLVAAAFPQLVHQAPWGGSLSSGAVEHGAASSSDRQGLARTLSAAMQPLAHATSTPPVAANDLGAAGTAGSGSLARRFNAAGQGATGGGEFPLTGSGSPAGQGAAAGGQLSLTGSGSPAGQGAPASARGDYSPSQARRDLAAALRGRPGQTSGRYLGRDGAMKGWSDAKIQQLHEGIRTAQQFFPNMSQKDLAHMIIAEGAQESSGDYRLNVGGKPGDGQGFMQVTGQSVLKDFKQYGTPIQSPDGKVIADPHGHLDMSNVAQNIAIWAWYSHNSAAIHTSLDEKLHWHNPSGGPPGTFGDGQIAWNQGPHVRNTQPNSDYNKRMRDYFVQSGFGTAADFDRLQHTGIVGGLTNVHR